MKRAVCPMSPSSFLRVKPGAKTCKRNGGCSIPSLLSAAPHRHGAAARALNVNRGPPTPSGSVNVTLVVRALRLIHPIR